MLTGGAPSDDLGGDLGGELGVLAAILAHLRRVEVLRSALIVLRNIVADDASAVRLGGQGVRIRVKLTHPQHPHVHKQHRKLRELVHKDFLDFSTIEKDITGYDACFFCLGVSSIGMDAERYRHLTYDITLAAARPLARRGACRRSSGARPPAAAHSRLRPPHPAAGRRT